ncbi:MAG: segregation/condensation protein A [Acidobacteriota bacterium]|nr:segregation/condensation protein A [Acidobacteriota bacterium]
MDAQESHPGGPAAAVARDANAARSAGPARGLTFASLQLDLEVFSGPFDLLLALVLREELDLLELDLAAVVIAYLDHIEARHELHLESATEFILLIAALLELKSRLMLPGEDAHELLEVGPQEAAEELLERMLQVRRFQGAARSLCDRLASEAGVRFRGLPVPRELCRPAATGGGPPAEIPPDRSSGATDPPRSSPAPQAPPGARAERLGKAIGGLLRTPPRIDLRHIHAPRVTVAERLSHLRGLLGRGRFSFEDAVRDADRVTVAVTLFALLELYRRGEAEWEQAEPFGEITVLSPVRAARAGAAALPPMALAG